MENGNVKLARIILALNIIIMLGSNIVSFCMNAHYEKQLQESSYYQTMTEMQENAMGLDVPEEFKSVIVDMGTLGKNAMSVFNRILIFIIIDTSVFVISFIPQLLQKLLNIEMEYKPDAKAIAILALVDGLAIIGQIASIADYCNIINGLKI